MIQLILLAAAMIPGTAAPVQQSAPTQCPRDAEAVPTAFAAWADSEPVATDAGAVPPLVRVGQAVDVTLAPQSQVELAVVPGRTAASDDHAGVVRLTVDGPGIYRLALGTRAWVDVVKDGKTVESVSHGHGPACSGIRKIVDFDLVPGSYLIQIAASPDASARLMIVRR